MELAAIILTAGESTRMPGNKLLLPIRGSPMIAHIFETVVEAGFSPVVVVAGFEEPAIRIALEGRKVHFVSNPDWKLGLASSLQAGISVLPGAIDGVLIMLGDMPLVKASTLQTLKISFTAGGCRQIIYPTYEGRQGNPVLFPARFFDDILNLQGDRGAKELLKKHAADTVAVPVKSREVLLDCDTEEDYTRTLSLLKE